MAFKMKGNPYKMGKMATKSTIAKMKTSYKMKEAMAKMKSPMELKKDSPMDKYKSDAQRKAVHASKAERGMTMKKEEAMKMKKPLKAAKPDYIDLDGDGNKTESMKKAAVEAAKLGGAKKKSPAKLAKGRSSDVMATEGKYKGQMVDPRTGMPKGVSAQPSKSEVANADQIAMLREKMKTVEPFSAEEEAIQQQIIRLRKGTSPAPMKSPMEKGKTSFIDKVKSAGKAIGDTMKQEIKNPAGHGTSDSFSHRLSRNYKARKKEARSSAVKQTDPNQKKVITKSGNTTVYTKGGRPGPGGQIEKSRQTTYTKNEDGTYTKKVNTAKKGAKTDLEKKERSSKVISAKKAERQIARKTKRAERSAKKAAKPAKKLRTTIFDSKDTKQAKKDINRVMADTSKKGKKVTLQRYKKAKRSGSNVIG